MRTSACAIARPTGPARSSARKDRRAPGSAAGRTGSCMRGTIWARSPWMRVALVTNAASGRGTDADCVAALMREAGATVTVHAFDASGSDDAVDEAARAAAAERPHRVAVAGGAGPTGP